MVKSLVILILLYAIYKFIKKPRQKAVSLNLSYTIEPKFPRGLENSSSVSQQKEK